MSFFNIIHDFKKKNAYIFVNFSWVSEKQLKILISRIFFLNFINKYLIFRTFFKKCKLSHNFKINNLSWTAFLFYLAPPEWIKEPTDIYTQEGESLEIECLASGIPAPSIKWLSVKYFFPQKPLFLRNNY